MSSSMVLTFLLLDLCSRILQRFSIGFKSGDCDGHSNTGAQFSTNHALVALAVCFGSSSCWNIHASSPKQASADGRIASVRILRCCTCSIIPSTTCKTPTLPLPEPPQTLILISCFTVSTENVSMCYAQCVCRWQVPLNVLYHQQHHVVCRGK